MPIAVRIAIALCLLSTACTPEGDPMPIGGRTVVIHDGPIDVGESDPRRAGIVDSMQRALEEDLEQPLRLEISSLREREGWAFATVYARTPGGAQIDWMRTHYADERRAGILEDDTTYVLLQLRGDAWKVRELSIGSPDNGWMEWGREYRAPKEIFWLAGG
ncbi:MAG: hypothetical protein ACOY82_16700 [Pseudomonadota bacterium]